VAPEGDVARARAAIARGRYSEAEQLLAAEARQEPLGNASLELGLLERMLGRTEAAARRLVPIMDAGASASSAAALLRAGRAARALGEFRDANGYFREASSLASDDPIINTEWGDLFLEKYNRQEAIRSYQAALKSSEAHAPAHLGLARALVDDNPPAALAAARRALALDPSLSEAHLIAAELALDDGKRESAKEEIGKALEINPSSLPARSTLAAVAYLEGRQQDFEAEVAKVLDIHPGYGDVYRVAGALAARNYRFDEAVALVKRGLELDPDNPRAHADLGIHLLRTGDEPAAQTALARAFRADPYDRVTYNLLELFDTLQTFETIKEGDIVMRLHPEEAPILRDYAMALAQESLRALSSRYQFAPKGPILVEIFPRHDDFAVRNVGLPGMIGALGACFGRVVTMDSPRARPPGTFNWAATLWHEMAHVITLQMSSQRVPRWLTEGISVFEEKRARPEWGREMELAFVQALERGQVLKLTDLNAGFQRPDTIALAYYQASLLVEHLVAAHGEPALHKLLRAFGTGIDTPQALLQALGLSIDQVQTSFDRALEQQFGALRRALRVPDGGPPADLEAARRAVESDPGSYYLQVALGQALRAAGDLDGAIAAFERAADLVPMATGQDSARGLLIETALAKGDRARALRELEALMAHDHTDVGAARRLAELAQAAADEQRMWLAYSRIVEIDPFDAGSHAALAKLALARKDGPVALREARAALAAGPVDRAAAHCDLGESYILVGRPADAKREALAALEIAPTYERAQELLLKAIEVKP
jgi:tetratricopeptide (TPR) repeat protein